MRSAKGAGNFPYRMSTVCYFEVYDDGKVVQIPHKNKCHLDGVREAFIRADKGITKLYAVWPGNWSSDLFIIDDLEAFAESFDLLSVAS